MHRTDTGDRIQALKIELSRIDSQLRSLARLRRQGVNVFDAFDQLTMRKVEAKRELEGLEASGRPRLEDLHVFTVEKETKKGKRNEYWHASWRLGEKVQNVYLGSCRKMDAQDAREKARRLKARDLGIEL
jgi:hypothetical protein